MSELLFLYLAWMFSISEGWFAFGLFDLLMLHGARWTPQSLMIESCQQCLKRWQILMKHQNLLLRCELELYEKMMSVSQAIARPRLLETFFSAHVTFSSSGLIAHFHQALPSFQPQSLLVSWVPPSHPQAWSSHWRKPEKRVSPPQANHARPELSLPPPKRQYYVPLPPSGILALTLSCYLGLLSSFFLIYELETCLIHSVCAYPAPTASAISRTHICAVSDKRPPRQRSHHGRQRQ